MITKEEVKKIYEDAKLIPEEDKLDEIREKFQKLIDFNSILMEADTEGKDLVEVGGDTKLVFREDEEEESLDREKALNFAKDRQYGYFRLQRVID